MAYEREKGIEDDTKVSIPVDWENNDNCIDFNF